MSASLKQRLGKYELMRIVGHGGMSTVYEALDTDDWRTVALKIINVPPSQSDSQEKQFLTRMRREIRIITTLSHPNIVTIHDVGERDDQHYIAMEYLNGTTLSRRIAAQPLALGEVATVVDQVAAALDTIHASGVVHRDVKPANIMIMPGDRVKLMDFGVARDVNDTMVTMNGNLIGSPAYMSPEQIQGAPASPASDIWALGVILYELLAGQAPFTGDNIPTVLYKVVHETPQPLMGTTARVRNVLARALAKNPAKRFATARDLADAFRAAAIGATVPVSLLPIPIQPAVRFDTGQRKRSYHLRHGARLAWVALGLFLVASISIGGFFIFHAGLPKPTVKTSMESIPAPRTAMVYPLEPR